MSADTLPGGLTPARLRRLDNEHDTATAIAAAVGLSIRAVCDARDQLGACPRCGTLREPSGDCPACPWVATPRTPRQALASDGFLLRTKGTGSKHLHRDLHREEQCQTLRAARREAVRVEAAAALPLRASLCSVCREVDDD